MRLPVVHGQCLRFEAGFSTCPRSVDMKKTINPKKSSEPLAFQEHSKSGFGPSSD